jgi:isopentenyl-diphosphate delta-isomerase
LAAHPIKGLQPFSFLGHTFNAPLWVSSMTGGTQLAYTINSNLARACKEFGFGMGLGSCRIILNDNKYFTDFDMREIIGDNLPFYANLGICQVEELVLQGKTQLLTDLVNRLRADGLIIHVNPMQEWFQPEGDKLKFPPIETIKRIIDTVKFPVIVKEVGQGMGPESLYELMKLPLAAIEFAAFGGTNFAKVELLRDTSPLKEVFEPLANIGMDAFQMLDNVNEIIKNDTKVLCPQIIISGGIKSFIDGFYLVKKSLMPAVYGQASSFLKYATNDYETLQLYVSGQIKGLEMAYSYLKIRE